MILNTTRSKKGFTVTELVIVIVVIAILAAVLIPTFVSLINKANMSADEQAVRQMNTILAAEEVSDKPATVTEAKDILIANGISDFAPTFESNTYYWVGADNRVLLWTADEEDATKGAVTFPKESVKKYKDLTEPSVDWFNLLEDLTVINVTPAEGETLYQALLDDVKSISTDEHVVLSMPKNATINLGNTGSYYLSNAFKSDAGVGKNVTIDLNGGTLISNEAYSDYYYGFTIPDNATVEFVDGTIDIIATASGFQVNTGASLVMRDIKLKGQAGNTMIAPLAAASEVIIDGSNLEIDAVFGIMTNGMTSSAIRIVITDTTLSNTVNGGGLGVLVNCTSNVHIENSKIVGSCHALAMRAGHAEVINTTLETISTDGDIYKYDAFKYQNKQPKHNGAYISGAPATYVWFDGNGLPGAVLVAGDYARETESYPGDVDIDLDNVTFKSANTTAVPHCLLAAKMTKNVTVDSTNTNMEDPVLYPFMIPEYFGSIKINGVSKTLN